MREDRRDGEAAGAFDVHEEGAGGGHECLSKGMCELCPACLFAKGMVVVVVVVRELTLSLCLRASACGVGLRRSTART